MTDDELRAAIRGAHALGLAVMVKPQVWVPQSWAGAVTMNFEENWAEWFANYGREIRPSRAHRHGREGRSVRHRHRAH